MITWLLIVLAVCCIVGIITSKIALGIVFIMALAITIWAALSLIQKDKFTNLGLIIVVIGLLSLVYTICELFFNIDLKTILGF